jgi:hypothetical protein
LQDWPKGVSYTLIRKTKTQVHNETSMLDVAGSELCCSVWKISSVKESHLRNGIRLHLAPYHLHIKYKYCSTVFHLPSSIDRYSQNGSSNLGSSFRILSLHPFDRSSNNIHIPFLRDHGTAFLSTQSHTNMEFASPRYRWFMYVAPNI